MSDIFGYGGDKSLIQILQNESAELDRLVNLFVKWVQNSSVKIAQFYETEKTNYGNALFRWNELVRYNFPPTATEF